MSPNSDEIQKEVVKPIPRLFYLVNRLRWWVLRPITVGVRLILVNDQAVCLVKHSYQRHWYLPGGAVGKGETLEEAARREAAEEIGAELGRLRLFGVYTNFYDYKNDHVIVLSCDELRVAGGKSAEIEDYKFFGFDELPDDLSPGSLRRIEEYFSLNGSPEVAVW